MNRNQSPVVKTSKLVRPGTFSNQAQLVTIKTPKRNHETKQEDQKFITTLNPSPFDDIQPHKPSKPKSSTSAQRKSKSKPKTPSKPMEISPKTDKSPSPSFGSKNGQDEQLTKMVQLSEQLVRELKALETHISENGQGQIQTETWILDIRNKLKQVQQNVQLVQQNIETSKESTASKSVENDQQIEDYLEQINIAKQSGGSSEIVTSLQNGILAKLYAELQDEKKQRLKIEQEASAQITQQEQEIQRLEQEIRALEQ